MEFEQNGCMCLSSTSVALDISVREAFQIVKIIDLSTLTATDVFDVTDTM
jgi:hypothetical protein